MIRRSSDDERREPANAPGATGRPSGLTDMLTPLHMPTTGQRIAERLVTAIALGEFTAGERLPTERELARQLQVNRASVREARRQLEAAGYVENRRGRFGGTFVVSEIGPEADHLIRGALPAAEQLDRLLDYRRLIEEQIARTAAKRRDQRDIEVIDAAVRAYGHATSRSESAAADLALHRAIALATHNSRLSDLSAAIGQEVRFGFEAEPYSPQAHASALVQHPELARAVMAGEPDEAARLAGLHFGLTEDLLKALHAQLAVRSHELPASGGSIPSPEQE
jgi:GntR family transcriptional regulator, transcriptional repressor for pyruvate dehydrogenase complex